MTHQPTLTTYAKVAPACVRIDSLFLLSSSIPPGQKLDARREIDGLVFHFCGEDQLAEDELAVLLALIALAGVQSDSYQRTKQYVGEPERRAAKMSSRSLEVRTSCGAFLREMGWPNNGKSWARLHNAMRRLFAVYAYLDPVGTMPSRRFHPRHLIQELDADGSRDTLIVKLCTTIAAGVLGGRGEFVQIDQAGFRALRDKSGRAQLLYYRLHGLPAGVPCALSDDRLLSFVHGASTASGSKLGMHRIRLREALERIGNLPGWVVERKAGGFSITRPNVLVKADRRSDSDVGRNGG